MCLNGLTKCLIGEFKVREVHIEGCPVVLPHCLQLLHIVFGFWWQTSKLLNGLMFRGFETIIMMNKDCVYIIKEYFM